MNVPVIDTFQFLGANIVPGAVSFDVRWVATGAATNLGKGTSVDPTSKEAFKGSFRAATATGTFSGAEIGFTFKSTPGASSDPAGFAELGTERNGSFL